MPPSEPVTAVSRREWLWLGLILLPILAFYIVAALRNHALYGTAAYDLGIFDQALWHASRFETPATTVRQIPSIFGDHFHPAILILAPIYWIGDGTRNLLAIQPILVLSAAFPIFAFARRRLAFSSSLLLTMAFALSWGVARGLGFDFHELALTTPALAFAIERFDARDRRGFWIAALVMLLTKEDQSLTLVMFGVLALLRRDRARDAVLPMLVGLAWYLFATKVASPLANEGKAYEHWVYGHLAPTPIALLIYLVSHPVKALGLMVTPSVKITLWYRTFVSFALLPFGSMYVLLAVPSLLARLLSHEPIHWEPSYHYSMPIMAIMTCATADVLGRVARSRLHERTPLVLAALVCLLSFGMNRGVLQRNQMFAPRTPPLVAQELDALIARIPPEATVTADNFVAPHLSKRDWILVVSDDRRTFRTDYYIFDPAVDPFSPRVAERMRTRTDYEEIGRAGPTVLYRRRAGVASDLPARPGDLPTLMLRY